MVFVKMKNCISIHTKNRYRASRYLFSTDQMRENMPGWKWNNENHPCNLCPSIWHHKEYAFPEMSLQSAMRMKEKANSNTERLNGWENSSPSIQSSDRVIFTNQIMVLNFTYMRNITSISKLENYKSRLIIFLQACII